jgi:hypothetical protein
VNAGRAALVVLATVMLAACGKSPQVEADPAAERAAATERAKKGPFGTQMKALETAKGLGADVNKKAQDEVDRAEK